MRSRTLGALENIRDALGYIIEDTSGVTFEEFVADRRTRQVVARNLGTIGVAIERLRHEDEAIVDLLSNADQFIALRSVRVDGREATAHSTVWQIVREQVPALAGDVDALLSQDATAQDEAEVGATELSQIITQNLEAIQALCREYGVSKLEVFGSAVTDRFDPSRSDVDFIVEFPPGYEFGPWHDRYFKLKERLAALLGRSVDLVMVEAIRKPRFIESANQTRRVLYAA